MTRWPRIARRSPWRCAARAGRGALRCSPSRGAPRRAGADAAATARCAPRPRSSRRRRCSETVRTVGTLVANESVTWSPSCRGGSCACDGRRGHRGRGGRAALQARRRRPARRSSPSSRCGADLAARTDAAPARAARVRQEGAEPAGLRPGAGSELRRLEAADRSAARDAREDARSARRSARASGLRRVSEGAWVTPETPLTTLQDTSRMKIDFALPERYAGAGRRRAAVHASASPGAATRFEGSVVAIEPAIDAPTRSLLRARASRENPDGALLPGAFVVGRGAGRAARRRASSCRPQAIVPSATGHAVYVLRDGRPSCARSRSACARREAVEVLRGLAVGDTVLTTQPAAPAARRARRARRGGRRRRRREPLRGQHPPPGARDGAARSSSCCSAASRFAFLGVREYPAVDPPIVTVHAELPGRQPGGDRVADHRAARAADQRHRRHPRAVLDLERGAQPDPRRVRGRRRPRGGRQRRARQVSRAIRELPPDADPPVVEKADADSEPILFLSVRSPTRSILEVNDFADRVRPRAHADDPGRQQRPHLRREALRDAALARPGAARGARPHAARRAGRARRRRTSTCRAGGSRATRSSSALRTAGRLTTPEEFDAMILEERGRPADPAARRRPRRARRREPAHRHQARAACR